MELYVVTHKSIDKWPADRTLIGVGKNRDLAGVTVYDNEGDNIAGKNANYCELTALYWMWKNSTADCLGLEHYRRFFCGNNIFRAKPLGKKKISKILEKCDIIVPRRNKAKGGIYGNYVKKHIKNDMDICVDIIKAMPEYAGEVDKALSAKKETVCNMFIMPKPLMDEYCEWLFTVLFEAEKKIDLSDHDDYEKRVFGFLSERLFNVWLYHKKLKIHYAKIYNLGDCPVLKKIKGLFRHIKKAFSK